MKIRDDIFMQPNLSYMPEPAKHPGIPGALAYTLRAILVS
jgi:hypothetical protein